MNFNSRILLSTAGLTSISLALSACTGAPAPCTEPESYIQETSAETKPEPKQVPQQTEQALPASSDSVAESKSQPAAKTADAIPSSASTASTATEKAADSVSYKLTVIDPYTAFPAMANEVFEHADSLYKQGNVDGAVSYLQRFRVIKPLWNQWEAQADSMLLEFGKTNAERAKQFDPLVLEIQNMNRARSSYSLVAEAADSLISLAPGDSLTRFAVQQKQVAYNNTLEKAKKEQAEILKLATDQARFSEAEQKALEFQMRYRDFEDALMTQAMIDNIHNMSATVDAEAAAYWQTNDPAAALTKAKDLVEKNKFSEAREILNKLKSSPLRKEALEEYSRLADNYCNAQRKTTSQLFGKAQKQKDANKKAELLRQAIESLDKCLSEYPDNSQKQKVLDNKNFLQKELQK